MSDICYYNHEGKLMLDLNESPYFIDSTDFKNWIWEYDTQLNRFRSFRRSKQVFSFTVCLLTESLEARDALCSAFDEDILAGKPGYLTFRGWKLECYVTEASHQYFRDAIDWKIEFNAISETSTWVREKTVSYSGIVEGAGGDLGRDYTYEDGSVGRGYNYGYSVMTEYSTNIVLLNDGNGFRVTFYGAVTNPVIYLNGKPVRVKTTIDSGEMLIVTSNGREKTIQKVYANGTVENAFIYRDKNNSPFFSIDKITELSYGNIKFDFTTIESRSEPSWN